MTRRGFTLIETMIYALLLGMLLTGIYAAFYISRLYYDSAQGTTEAQQESLRAMNAIGRVLSQGCASTLTTFSYANASPNLPTVGFRILSAKTPDGRFQHSSTTGELLWQRWVVLYLDPTATSGNPPTPQRELRMREWPLGVPVASPPASAPAAPALINGTVSPQPSNPVVLARSLGSGPQTSGSPRPGLVLTPSGNQLNFTVTSETQSRKFGINRVSINSTFALRQ